MQFILGMYQLGIQLYVEQPKIFAMITTIHIRHDEQQEQNIRG